MPASQIFVDLKCNLVRTILANYIIKQKFELLSFGNLEMQLQSKFKDKDFVVWLLQ